MIVNNGIYEFHPLAATGKALNMWGSAAGQNVNVNLYTSDHSNTQKWRAVTQTDAPAGTGTFLLHCMANESYVLDRYRGSSALNNADIYTKGTTAADLNDQIVKFTLCGTEGSNQVYYISLASDGKRLSIVDGNNGNGTGKTSTSTGNVYFGGSNDALQKWVAVPANGGGGTSGSLTEGVRPSNLNYSSTNYASGTNPFPSGQCTWHVWGRVREVLGKDITFDITTGRNGNAWYEHVTNALGKSTAEPTVGRHAIICWGNGTYGHVAFVEKYDGTNVWLTEANYDQNDAVNSSDGIVVKCTLAGAKSHVKSGFQGFLLL